MEAIHGVGVGSFATCVLHYVVYSLEGRTHLLLGNVEDVFETETNGNFLSFVSFRFCRFEKDLDISSGDCSLFFLACLVMKVDIARFIRGRSINSNFIGKKCDESSRGQNVTGHTLIKIIPT